MESDEIKLLLFPFARNEVVIWEGKIYTVIASTLLTGSYLADGIRDLLEDGDKELANCIFVKETYEIQSATARDIASVAERRGA